MKEFRNWHGATATTAMTHIAIVEQLDGKTTDWMESEIYPTVEGLFNFGPTLAVATESRFSSPRRSIR